MTIRLVFEVIAEQIPVLLDLLIGCHTQGEMVMIDFPHQFQGIVVLLVDAVNQVGDDRLSAGSTSIASTNARELNRNTGSVQFL